jgi:stalled ribosome alternative rescue factor ArfA
MMKKRHKIKQLTVSVIKNPVAKYAHQFNKAQTFKDKTGYQRRAKHKGREPFIMSLHKGITKGCLFFSGFPFKGECWQIASLNRRLSVPV